MFGERRRRATGEVLKSVRLSLMSTRMMEREREGGVVSAGVGT